MSARAQGTTHELCARMVATTVDTLGDECVRRVKQAIGGRQSIADVGLIERVVITAPVMNYIDRPLPSHGREWKFSFQYTAAAALLDGKVGIDSFTDERRFRADMETLLRKIELRADPAIRGDWLNVSVTIEVVESGCTHTCTCTAPRGAWGEPPLCRQEYETKLRDCPGRGLEADAIDELLDLLDRLESLDPGACAASARSSLKPTAG